MKSLLIAIALYIITLSIGVPYAVNLRNKINALKSELSTQKKTFDLRLKTEITRAESEVTDSLINHYESKEPITKAKTKIQYKYDTIIDSVLYMPSSEQYNYSANELNQLYPD